MTTENKNFFLKENSLNLPPSPGVYLMKNNKDKIIYVGKAKNLPKRVSSYFNNSPKSVRVNLMVSQIANFDFIVTGTEKESLILENSLIKKHRPKFNVILRDDKTYPSLRIKTDVDFPRLEIVRKPKKDNSIIFGPFPSSGALRETVRLITRLFPLRQCRKPDVKNIKRPCLNYQIGRCIGPCRQEISKEDYQEIVEQVKLFFKGQNKDLVVKLQNEMEKAATEFKFEKAAKIRDQLVGIKKTIEKQIVDQVDNKDQDVFAVYQENGLALAAVLLIRAGRINGFLSFNLTNESQNNTPEILASLISQYYNQGHYIPDEIYLSEIIEPEEREIIEAWLSDEKGKKIKLATPQRGDKLKLIEMAQKNAQVSLEEKIKSIAKNQGLMAIIQEELFLSKIPRKIECIDIAHLQGDSAVAGLVVMEEGSFKKANYKRFKIAKENAGDDYASMAEVIKRRFKRDDWPLPDLLLIDGGKGQLNISQKVLEELNINFTNIAAITEAREFNNIDLVFIPKRKNPLNLKKGSEVLLFLSQIRDEAHRYARTYHHQLRSKTIKSSLTDIVGIGPIKSKKLLSHFGSLANIKKANREAILKVTFLPEESFQALKDL